MGQFDWELSNTRISYPFVQPGAGALNAAFADAFVIDTAQSQLVRLDSVDITDWDPAYIAVTVNYADGSSFFDATPVIAVSAYGQWQVITLSSAGKIVQLLMDGAHALPITYTPSSSDYSPLYFVARVQECDPTSVQSIEATDGETGYTGVLSGDIELSAGYNIALQQAAGVGASSVSISATPGAGVGVAPSSCVPAAVLRSINTVGPDVNGKLILSATDCYRAIIPSSGSVDPAVFNPSPAMMQLCNDCGQCCSCADYENCYRALARLHANGANTGLRLARTIDDFDDMNSAINTQRQQRSVPTMELLLRPAPGYIMGVQINFLNNGTASDIYMNKTIFEEVLAKMYVTSADADMTEAVILASTDNSLSSCYLFNSQYGNPWLHVIPSDIFVYDPDDPTLKSTNGVGLTVIEDLVASKFYHVIKTTQFVSIFFEIFWRDAGAPAAGDEISVRLASDVFKPYTLTKTDVLAAPFDGDI